jgi:hypothetical protein
MHMRLIMKDNWLYAIKSLVVFQHDFDRFANSLEFLPSRQLAPREEEA